MAMIVTRTHTPDPKPNSLQSVSNAETSSKASSLSDPCPKSEEGALSGESGEEKR